ncbi:hypothetical protein PTKIN_Ptkin01aG0142800 [Pterospermum kingtungense]
MIMNKNWKFVRLRQEYEVGIVLCQSLVCWSLNEEGLALLRLRDRVVNDPFGALSDWKEEDGEFDHCSRFGVECFDGKVIVLNLKDLCIEGTLAPELGTLAHIKSILLDNNEFLSSFSPEIYQLQKILETQVDENQPFNADVVRKRQLQEIPAIPAIPPKAPSINFSIPSPPSHAPQVPTSSASAERSRNSTFARDAPVQGPSLAPAPSPSENNTLLHNNASCPSPLGSNPLSSSSNHRTAIIAGAVGSVIFLIILIIITYIFKTSKVSAVKPWATGLSGQLQKTFVTGVPKLKRSELEAACEDFSNVIVKSAKDWSNNLEIQFRKKIDMLSKVNHKNFVNLLGYCEEDKPFTRMMVFEYVPNGTLIEHLHIKESEHLDWAMRLRIVMGMGYCVEHMHQLNPPIPHNNLSSSAVNLTEDYAAKISDMCFCNEITSEKEADRKSLANIPLVSLQSNVYSFGVLLFEVLTGRMPYLADNCSLEDWASDYLRREQALIDMVDPSLEFFEKEQLEKIGKVIKSCVHREPRLRNHRKVEGDNCNYT